MQGATVTCPYCYSRLTGFQSTPPMQGATQLCSGASQPSDHFNPRPLCRGRRDNVHQTDGERWKFQSTPPMQGATVALTKPSLMAEYFNPRPLCRGRPCSLANLLFAILHFNPRPLCRGRPASELGAHARHLPFQSTPPMQGATRRADSPYGQHSGFQSTPPMQGATRLGAGRTRPAFAISIHAPYAGGDAKG